MTRREFLNYIWLASMALLLAKAGSTAWQFALPRVPVRLNTLRVRDIPAVNAKPVRLGVHVLSDEIGRVPGQVFTGERYDVYVSYAADGVHAFMSRCTHMGCAFAWDEAINKFECPCHGSQFAHDGTYIAGPAPRHLDRFPIVAKDALGNIVAETRDGSAWVIPSAAATITIDYSKVILGARYP